MNTRSSPKTHLISQQSTANHSVTFFKLKSPDGDLEPGTSTLPRRSKRVKVEEEILNVEEVVNAKVSCLGCQGSDGQGEEGKGRSITALRIFTEAQSYQVSGQAIS